MAATRDGEILAAYRDRTEDEIRDIAVARLTKDGWQPPVRVHDDGWELAGCPVNGPAISTHEDRVAVAWFTGADDVAAVQPVHEFALCGGSHGPVAATAPVEFSPRERRSCQPRP